MGVGKVMFVVTSLDSTRGGIAANNVNYLKVISERYDVECINLQINSYGVSFAKKMKLITKIVSLNKYKYIIFDHVHLMRVMRLYLNSICPKKVIVLAHGSESYYAMTKQDKHLYNSSRLVICNSKVTRLRHIEAGGSEKSAVCQLAASEEKVFGEVKETLTRKNKISLLIVSRIDARENEKGHEQLINVMLQLDDEYELRIVGSGSGLPSLKKLVKEKELTDRVKFLNHITDAELRHEYKYASMYVMPSRQEGFGLVFVEAMGWGLPILGCIGDAAEELIIDKKNGRLIGNEVDEDELLHAIKDIAKHEKSYSRAAKIYFDNMFTFSAFHNRLGKIFDKLDNNLL